MVPEIVVPMRTGLVLLDELNSFIHSKHPPRAPQDLCWKLKHLGWKEWQFVGWDSETETFQFFNTHDAYDRYLGLWARFLIEDVERLECVHCSEIWKLNDEFNQGYDYGAPTIR